MKKECIFKVFSRGTWYYVYQMPVPGDAIGSMFRVYCGRKRYGVFDYGSRRAAVEVCLAAAVGVGVSIEGVIAL